MIKREKLADQKRLPRFQIRACSALVHFQAAQFADFLFEKGSGGENVTLR
jgi:hypothetical protein